MLILIVNYLKIKIMGNTNNEKKGIDNKIINIEKLKDIKPVNLVEIVKSKYIRN